MSYSSVFESCREQAVEAAPSVNITAVSGFNLTDAPAASAWQLQQQQQQQAYNNAVAQCIADTLQQQQADDRANLNHWLLVLSGSLVFIMQVGFAMLCAGCVRKKNVQNTMLKNLLDACGAAVAFYLVGYAFAFGGQDSVVGNTFIGSTNFLLTGSDPVNMSFWFFQWAFSATTVTIVAGTLAERCQMIAYLTYSLYLTGFVYPVVVHSVWSNNGFLSIASASPLMGCGSVDFAGSGVVHVTGGITSLIATYILGARRGRFHDERGRPLEEPNPIPGHSIALQLLGTMILWFGWYGFNPGSALVLTNATSQGAVASVAAANTSLAASVGAISGMLIQLYVQERRTGESHYDLTAAMNGCLAGLVAVTASCAVIEYWAAIIIGAVAGGLYLLGSATLVRLKLDDAVDAVPVHLVNGAWGLIATGFLASPSRCQDAFGSSFTHAGLFYTIRDGVDFTLLLNQFVELVFILGWTSATMLPFFMWLNYMGWFRSDSLEELVGLDISYHGGHQYEEEMVHEEFIKTFMEKKGLRRRRVGTRRQDADAEDEPADADSVSWAGFDAASPEQPGSASRFSKKSSPVESHPSSGRFKKKDETIKV